MEAILLVAALCIVALTTLTLANENHWARSDAWTRWARCIAFGSNSEFTVATCPDFIRVHTC